MKLMGAAVAALIMAGASLTGVAADASVVGSVPGAPQAGVATVAVPGVAAIDGAAVLPVGAPGADPTPIGASWQDETTHLTWTGRQYTTIEQSFVGDRVASPGDKVQRTLDIVNNGPSAAAMTVSLRLGQQVPDGAQNLGLADDVIVFWDVDGLAGRQTFATLLTAGQDSVVATLDVPKGATVPVTVGYVMADNITTSRSEGAASVVLAFDVVVHMQGDTQPDAVMAASTGGTILDGGLPYVGGLLVLAGGILLLYRSSCRLSVILPQAGSSPS